MNVWLNRLHHGCALVFCWAINCFSSVSTVCINNIFEITVRSSCHKYRKLLKTHIDNIYICSVTIIRILYLGFIRHVLVSTSINTIYSLVIRKFVLVHWWMNGESDGSARAGARAGASMSLTVAVWEAEARVKSQVSYVATDRQLGRCLYILRISICKQWVPLL